MSEFCMWMIPLLPLLGSVVIAAIGRRWFPDKCHIPCIAGAVGACFFSILVFFAVASGDGKPILTGVNTPWISAGDVTANFSLRGDGVGGAVLRAVSRRRAAAGRRGAGAVVRAEAALADAGDAVFLVPGPAEAVAVGGAGLVARGPWSRPSTSPRRPLAGSPRCGSSPCTPRRRTSGRCHTAHWCCTPAYTPLHRSRAIRTRRPRRMARARTRRPEHIPLLHRVEALALLHDPLVMTHVPGLLAHVAPGLGSRSC